MNRWKKAHANLEFGQESIYSETQKKQRLDVELRAKIGLQPISLAHDIVSLKLNLVNQAVSGWYVAKRLLKLT